MSGGLKPTAIGYLILVVTVLGGQARAIRAQPANPTPSPDSIEHARRDRIVSVARDIMSAARYCSLITIGEKGQPQARVVDPTPPDGLLTVYVATNPRSRKVAEIGRDPRVTLLYFDSSRPGYVTVIGRAIEAHGSEKSAHHKNEWRSFFAIDQPDSYTLYRIVPSHLEVVSVRDGLSGDPATWRPEIVDLR